MEWTKAEFSVTCDPDKQDLDVIHGFLNQSYWANGIPKETVRRSLQGSLCFALLHQGKQVGFARVISDFATVAYLGDVFVLQGYRGRGLSQWLMECVSSHPNLQGLRRWLLATSDAHGLYAKYGFTALNKPQLFMERHDPNVYTRDAQQTVAADPSEDAAPAER
jgi:N-acetylglutamate synthase-like GNAT family acetyltransferase